MKALEFEICEKSDSATSPMLCSRVDLVAREIGGDRVFASLPVYAFDQEYLARGTRMLDAIQLKAGRRMLFVGGFNHRPDSDGILPFSHEVFPELRRLPDAHLTIVGSRPPASVTLALPRPELEPASKFTNKAQTIRMDRWSC